MNDAIRAADRHHVKALAQIQSAYAVATEPVIKRYGKVLDRMGAYIDKGQTALAVALFKKSGFMDALANAIAGAGVEAGKIIRQQRADILEVMADDDGS